MVDQMSDDITTRLRQTRADMIGTEDEDHYWDCHDAAASSYHARSCVSRRRGADLLPRGGAIKNSGKTGYAATCRPLVVPVVLAVAAALLAETTARD